MAQAGPELDTWKACLSCQDNYLNFQIHSSEEITCFAGKLYFGMKHLDVVV